MRPSQESFPQRAPRLGGLWAQLSPVHLPTGRKAQNSKVMSMGRASWRWGQRLRGVSVEPPHCPGGEVGGRMGRGPARWRWERANRTGGILQNPAPPCWHLQSWEAQGCPQLEEGTAAIQSREQSLGAMEGGVQGEEGDVTNSNTHRPS